MAQRELLDPTHVGDGVYLHDEGYRLAIAVNHHTNKVVYLEANEIHGVIDYAKKAGLIK